MVSFESYFVPHLRGELSDALGQCSATQVLMVLVAGEGTNIIRQSPKIISDTCNPILNTVKLVPTAYLRLY